MGHIESEASLSESEIDNLVTGVCVCVLCAFVILILNLS